MKFKVTYATGLSEEIELSDCSSIDEVANRVFGMALDEIQAAGADISIANAAEAAEPEVAQPDDSQPIIEENQDVEAS